MAASVYVANKTTLLSLDLLHCVSLCAVTQLVSVPDPAQIASSIMCRDTGSDPSWGGGGGGGGGGGSGAKTITQHVKTSTRTDIIPNDNNLGNTSIDIVHLSNKHSCHSLVQRSTVHVDGGPHGQHKASDTGVGGKVLLKTLDGDRESCRAV